MGLLDMFKDKAAELIQGAKEQVSEVIGIDGVTDQIDQIEGSATEAGQNLADTGQNLADTGQNLADTGQNIADTAVNDVTDRLTGN
jgi:hypothetical protein